MDDVDDVTDTNGVTVSPEGLAHILAVLRLGHRYVEDTWYSCPQSEEGCCDDSQGDACNCDHRHRHAAADLIERSMCQAGDGKYVVIHRDPAARSWRFEVHEPQPWWRRLIAGPPSPRRSLIYDDELVGDG